MWTNIKNSIVKLYLHFYLKILYYRIIVYYWVMQRLKRYAQEVVRKSDKVTSLYEKNYDRYMEIVRQNGSMSVI